MEDESTRSWMPPQTYRTARYCSGSAPVPDGYRSSSWKVPCALPRPWLHVGPGTSSSSGGGGLRPKSTAAWWALPCRPRVRPASSAKTTEGSNPCDRAHSLTVTPWRSSHCLASAGVLMGIMADNVTTHTTNVNIVDSLRGFANAWKKVG